MNNFIKFKYLGLLPTGKYAHQHTVVDNWAPVSEGLVFFPQYLQKAGYQTACRQLLI